MKNILLKFFLIFAVFFPVELVAEEKNYHKELITDWSRIFPDKNRNAAGPKFFRYIIDKKITYKDFIEFNKLYCAVSGSLIDPESDSEFLFVKESKTKKTKSEKSLLNHHFKDLGAITRSDSNRALKT